MSGYRIVAVFMLIAFGYVSACAQSDRRSSVPDTIRHLPGKAVEITAQRPSGLATVDARGAEIKPATVLTQETGSQLASDALRAMSSSLDIRRYGSLGSIAVPSFRGLPAEYTTVYRDGILLTNEQLGETDLGQLTLHGISRVELIPASTAILLGGDAIGAAIDLISEVRDSNQLAIGTEQTSYDGTSGFPTQSYYATASINPLPSLSIVVGGSLDQSTGAFPFFQDSTHPNVLRANNDAAIRSANLSAWYDAGSGTSLQLLSNYFFADRGSPSKGTIQGAYNLTARQRDEQNLESIHIEHRGEEWTSSVDIHYQNQFESYRDRKIELSDSATNQLFGLSARSSRQFAGWLIGYAGADYLHTGLTGSEIIIPNGYPALARNRIEGYAAASFLPIEALRIAASLKPEYVSDINRFDLLPQFNIQYEPAHAVDLSAAYSKSVHAPTLNDLYFKLYGNPGLKTETADNYQAAIAASPEVLGLHPNFSVTYFIARIQNEIIWQPDTAGTDAWYPYNIGIASIHGVELRAAGSINLGGQSSLHLEESYTILSARNQNPDDTNYGKELIYSSPTSSLFIAELERNDWGSLSTMIRYRGHRFTDANNNPFHVLPPVTTVALTLTTRSFEFEHIGFRIMLFIDNLTDQHYEDALDYPLPGRTYKFSIELQYP